MTTRMQFGGLLVLSAFLAGCASDTRPFEGVGPDGISAPEVRYVLPTEGPAPAVIALHARGRVDDEGANPDDGLVTDTIRIEVTIDNPAAQPLELALASFSAKDDAGRTWPQAEVSTPSAAGSGDLLVVPAGQRTTALILFDSGARGVLETTGSLTIDWEARQAGKTHAKRTRFIPAPRTVYVDRGPRVGFGFFHGHHVW